MTKIVQANFNKSLFWDVDYEKINYTKNARFVVERVLTRGNLEDWYELKKIYGTDKIKEEVLKIRYLDKLTFNFCQKIFNIKKEKFICYNTEQSIRELWNY